MGESWHNSHHADPTSARHGVLRGQIDISARMIWMLEKARLGLQRALADGAAAGPPRQVRRDRLMSDLFSHQELDADVAVKAKKSPAGVVFLEPAGSGAQDQTEEEDSAKRPIRPSFS